jgi:predicted aspartyl protease
MFDKVILLNTAAAVMLLALLDVGPGQAAGSMEEADSLFARGYFSQAEALCQKLKTEMPDNARVRLMLGRIALYGNKFAQAEENLELVAADSASRSEALLLLAENYYRQDRFAEAAPLLAEAGREAKSAKLAAFKDRTPYQIEGPETAEVPFVQTDPLPLVMLNVNGREAMFLIDTGGWELGIDEELAQELGIEKLGTETATFAGGRTASTYHGILDSVMIGGVTVRNVPVSISQGAKRAAQMFQKPIRGILGTCFLYHFNFTFDYPDGKLLLARRNSGRPVKKRAGASMPFWMAGDHIMVAWGKVNRGDPQLFFVDTGLAGGGFTATEATIRAAGIKLGEAKEGMGGGGAVQVRPFTVDRLALGGAEERNVAGLFGALPPDFESRFGFTIGGIISHGFFRSYRLTFDFDLMKIFLQRTKE